MEHPKGSPTGHQSMMPGGKGGPGRGHGSTGSGNSGAGRHQPLTPGRSRGRGSGGLALSGPKSRSNKRSECFITTACAEARGLPDDCEQLRLLRLFREGYVRDLPDGAEVLAEYDEKAPRIVAAIGALPPSVAEAVWEWVFEQIEVAVTHIRQWRFDSAYRLYAEACMELEALLLRHPERDPERDPEPDPGRHTDPAPPVHARQTATQAEASQAPARKEKVEA